MYNAPESNALIGPSGCGKSTFLRCFNRMNDTIDGCRTTGNITFDDRNVLASNEDVVRLRQKVGIVFQKPNPFPKSIYENIAYGPRIHGLAENKVELDEIVEASLKRAGLWQEVKDRLDRPGTGLSGGQQQRLVIARAIAIRHGALRWSATASVHRACHCGQPGTYTDGRAVFRARPDRDGKD